MEGHAKPDDTETIRLNFERHVTESNLMRPKVHFDVDEVLSRTAPFVRDFQVHLITNMSELVVIGKLTPDDVGAVPNVFIGTVVVEL